MPTYAIGDVQGCYDSLEALVAQIKFEPDKDTIWLAGDMVNRGPKSAEVLRWVMAQGDAVVCVLGNHDLHLLAAAEGARKQKKRDTFNDILDAPDCDLLLAWLRKRPLLHRANQHLLVHAGLHPDWSLDLAESLAAEAQTAIRTGAWLGAWKQTRPTPPAWSTSLQAEERIACALSVFTSIRTVYDDNRLCTDFAGPAAQCPSDVSPWFDHRSDKETIVFGHWAALGLYVTKRAIGVDTGCVWGNKLTAVRLEDRTVFSQPAID